MNAKILSTYADLIIRTGVNLQKGEMLVINAPIDSRGLVEKVVKSAYRAGARNVEVQWLDDKISRLNYKYRSKKELTKIPDWVIKQKDHYIDEKIAFLRILSDNPESLKGVNPEKVAAARRASGKALAKFRDYTGSNKLRWCIAAYPQKDWAKKMFPELSPSAAMKKQWEYIAETMRLNCDDPIKAWEKHQQEISRRCEILNGAKIKTFTYKNSLGTNFTVGMPQGYIFCGGAEKGALDGIRFTANMPTEEVFSCPDRRTANGKLVAAMPLCRNG
ncbi:MAG: aminopeptidase, partial [Clostridia bacterium]|nr:aminopeptidase [Clostridia bacterium]